MGNKKRIDRLFKGFALFIWILTFIWLNTYFGSRDNFSQTLVLIGVPTLVYAGIGFLLPWLIFSRKGSFEDKDEPTED